MCSHQHYFKTDHLNTLKIGFEIVGLSSRSGGTTNMIIKSLRLVLNSDYLCNLLIR